MTDCTAKVTTADVTDEAVASVCFAPTEGPHFHRDDIADGETAQRQGNRLVRVDLHENGCRGNTGDDHVSLHYNGHLRWPDSLPGATSHEDVTVSDAEVDAALEAYRFQSGSGDSWFNAEPGRMRMALLAAKRVERRTIG